LKDCARRHTRHAAMATFRLPNALEVTRFEVYQAYLDELAAPAARRAKER